jgi:tRNA-dihydrouridine synthase B
VHGRTRADRFLGAAEYDTIAEIVDAVSIPVFANGDIDSSEKALAVLAQTGAAGIMIGRAAQGRPWFCGQVAAALAGTPGEAPSLAEQGALLSEHIEALHDFYGPIPGARIARKHVGWALSDLGEAGEAFRRGFKAIEAPEGQLEALSDFYGARRAAA